MDTDSDGRADAAHVLIRGLDHPNGVVWLGGSLFVQTTRQLLRYDGIDAFALAGKVTETTEKNGKPDAVRIDVHPQGTMRKLSHQFGPTVPRLTKSQRLSGKVIVTCGRRHRQSPCWSATS